MFNLTPNFKQPLHCEFAVPGYGPCWLTIRQSPLTVMAYTRSVRLYKFLIADGAIPIYSTDGACLIAIDDTVSVESAVTWAEFYARRIRSYDMLHTVGSLVSAKEACRILGKTDREIRGLIEDGDLVGYMVDGGKSFVVNIASIVCWEERGIRDAPPIVGVWDAVPHSS